MSIMNQRCTRTSIAVGIAAIASCLLGSCAPFQRSQTPLETYIEYVQKVDIKTQPIYYQELVSRLGDPEIKNETAYGIIATWQEKYLGTGYAGEYSGRKLIMKFDKSDQRLTDYQIKTW